MSNGRLHNGEQKKEWHRQTRQRCHRHIWIKSDCCDSWPTWHDHGEPMATPSIWSQKHTSAITDHIMTTGHNIKWHHFGNRSQFFLNIKCHNGYFWECMLPHTKRQVKFHKMHCFTMFITALCIVFLIKLRWPKDKSLCDIVLTSLSSSLHLTVGEIPGRAKATPETYSFVISSWLDLVMFGRKRPRPSSFGGEAKNCSISPNFLLALRSIVSKC